MPNRASYCDCPNSTPLPPWWPRLEGSTRRTLPGPLPPATATRPPWPASEDKIDHNRVFFDKNIHFIVSSRSHPAMSRLLFDMPWSAQSGPHCLENHSGGLHKEPGSNTSPGRVPHGNSLGLQLQYSQKGSRHLCEGSDRNLRLLDIHLDKIFMSF